MQLFGFIISLSQTDYIFYNNKPFNCIMEKILKQAAELYAAFAADANSQVEKGNKAAGTRARKASLELEKLMKEFRKASLAAAK